MTATDLGRFFERNGYAVVPGLLTVAEVTGLIGVIEPYCRECEAGTGKAIHAIRNLITELPTLAGVVCMPGVRELVMYLLGPDAFVVRAIYFDKLPGANWKVAWHQDQAIAVKGRADLAGYGPWSVKQGVQHVEPPASVLEKMLSLRIHLDDCGADNGPLRVAPGSHRFGRLANTDAERVRQSRDEVICTAGAGDAVLMRPLLLHASSQSESPGHRRVLHFEFASQSLPQAIEWAGPLIALKDSHNTTL